jgi:prolyl-tRNA synthetase
MFNITVEDPVLSETGEKKPPIHVWQNSWGLTTRSIGVMILTHGDNQGLVVPPRVAEVQVVIIPVGVTNKTTTEQKQKLYKEAEAIAEVLREADVRVQVDLREQYTTGWKFNDWELKGVPLRIEFGPKDSEKHVVTTARRDQALQKTKGTVQISQLGTDIPALLEEMQADMLKTADDEYRSHRKVIKDWADFVPALNAKNVCLIPHCLDEDAGGKDQGGKCEDHIKEISARKDTGDEMAVDAKAPSMGAKSLCIPYEQPEEIPSGTKCLNPDCQNMAKKWVMFGRSY